MSQIWLTSDEHYYHDNIRRYGNRPFENISIMNRGLIKRHNEIVSDDDVVYHLGDFLWPSNRDWRSIQNILLQLKGKHHLIIGNHDSFKIWDYCEAGFLSVHTSLELDGYTLVHDPAVAGVITDRKWIHGHTHRISIRLGDNSFCVCVELWDYYPVNFNKIKEVF